MDLILEKLMKSEILYTMKRLQNTLGEKIAHDLIALTSQTALQREQPITTSLAQIGCIDEVNEA